jgi:flagellar biosynthesis protein FliR
MNLLEPLVVAFLLIVARVGMFLTTFPLFRGGTVPQTVKVAMAVSLSVMWLPDLPLPSAELTSAAGGAVWIHYGLGIAREAVIGAVFGYGLGLFFLPIQIAGYYLGQEIGFNMAGMTDPTTDATTNVFGDLLSALATLLFFAADAHLLAIGALQASFEHLPLGRSSRLFTPPAVTQSFSDAHRWGMQLSGPIGVGLFLTTIITALLMKISPQLNLLSVGTPLRLLVGLGIAMVFLPDTVAMMVAIVQQQAHFVERLGW